MQSVAAAMMPGRQTCDVPGASRTASFHFHQLLGREGKAICFIESLILSGSKTENGLGLRRVGKALITRCRTRRIGTNLHKLTPHIFPVIHWSNRSFLFGMRLSSLE